MESEAQEMCLPEEDPAIFHFVIAFLYEGRYSPIKPIANALSMRLVSDGSAGDGSAGADISPDQDLDKGKGKDTSQESSDSGSDSDSSVLSNSSAESRRQGERRRRREERQRELARQKHPGQHRPGCNCQQCTGMSGPPCWNCGASRTPPPHGPLHPANMIVVEDARTRRGQRRRGPPPPPGSAGTTPPANPDPYGGGRIEGEDLRTWLMAYELNLDVYICANKFLMDDFKEAVAKSCVDMLETAGSDAAQPEVLRLCRKLYEGVSESDILLKRIFARVGFLQRLLWQRAAAETSDFLVSNPEVAALMLRETAARREEDHQGRHLPSMERSVFMPIPPNLYGRMVPPRGMPHHPPLRRW